MSLYFLGADLGGSKTRVAISDKNGLVLGYDEGGPGNHEVVGLDGFQANLRQAVESALASAGIQPAEIAGSGFGIGGYDWPSQTATLLERIRPLGLGGAVELVNDVELGLLAGSERGWGVAVVSGTGCNCRGWDATRQRRGRVTGGGAEFGEFAGASELMILTTQALAYEWTGRRPPSLLSAALVENFKLSSLEQLIEEIMCRRLWLDGSLAPLVCQVAARGDPMAQELIRQAGQGLGEMSLTVIHQLGFEDLEFDLVQIGSLFEGSPLLGEEMKKVVLAAAPGAKFIHLQAPPVLGAVLLGMQAAGTQPDAQVRWQLSASISGLYRNRKSAG